MNQAGEKTIVFTDGLRFRLIITLNIVVLAVISTMGFVLTHLMSNELLRHAERSVISNLSETNNSLDYFYGLYLAKSDSIFVNEDIIQKITRPDMDLSTRLETQKVIRQKLWGYITYDLKYPEVKSSYYFGGSTLVKMYVKNPSLVDDFDFFPYDEALKEPWIDQLITDKRMFAWNSRSYQNGRYYISFNRRVLDTKSLDDIAILRVFIPVEKVRNFLSQNTNDMIEAYIYSDDKFQPITEGGRRKFSLDLDQLGNTAGNLKEIDTDDGKMLTGTICSELTNWNLTYIVSKDMVLKQTGYIVLIIIIIIAISIFVCATAATWIASRITKRIENLVYKTRSLSLGNLDFIESLKDTGKDEIGALHSAFDIMAIKIQDLNRREYESKILLNEVRAELLQEQINPHLLYNSLSIIKQAALQSEGNDVYQLTDSLINFYRSVLNRGNIISSIRSEVFMIRNFIDLTRKVYGLKVEFRVIMPDEVMDYYSVKLFLQPIVENAVLHGIKPIGRGNVVIEAHIETNAICFTVSDDGIGIEDDTLQGIMSVMSTNSPDCSYTGYGLLNVNKRINLFFGPDWGMNISSQAGEGTVVTLRIPRFTETEINGWFNDRCFAGI